MVLNDSLDAPQNQTLRKGETDGVRVDYTDYLRTGETISSVGSVAITGESTAVTVASAAVSTGALSVLGASVAAGAAVTFNVVAGSTATSGHYEATITATTSTSRISVRRIGLTVVG
tara:strand:- start:549 stop:899 length:351 start_codon:yes stop_codon:yes gene_type:complete